MNWLNGLKIKVGHIYMSHTIHINQRKGCTDWKWTIKKILYANKNEKKVGISAPYETK